MNHKTTARITAATFFSRLAQAQGYLAEVVDAKVALDAESVWKECVKLEADLNVDLEATSLVLYKEDLKAAHYNVKQAALKKDAPLHVYVMFLASALEKIDAVLTQYDIDQRADLEEQRVIFMESFEMDAFYTHPEFGTGAAIDMPDESHIEIILSNNSKGESTRYVAHWTEFKAGGWTLVK
ncbi:hypothetical protein F2P58_23260 [Vibrio fortis]|uniref:Uncharacterized protein n=1 Tax=Vibrio fortis TaxID=212667 RepID=A0A5N3QTB8_9VIBR|nr:hypothetical protein [Vibrio fortis]KAB0285437.1 hypothetical protein F2P58_23260 [Vibrio fortis]